MKRLNKPIQTGICIFAVNVVQSVLGATLSLSSLTPTAVQSAINAAGTGDTILLPAGAASWTSGVTVGGKAIHIQGSGIGVTNITYEIPESAAMFSINTTGDYASRISDMTVLQGSGPTSSWGIVQVSSTSKVDWRVYNIRFANLRGRGMVVSGYEGGLIDHCVFDTATDAVAQGVTIFGDKRASWQRGPSFGTDRAVYIEDCTFDFFGPGDAGIEGYRGARFVARYNIIKNTMIGAHGFDSDPFVNGSTYSWEIYKNIFTLTDNTKGTIYHQMRGGSGVLWGNRYWARWQGGGVNTFYGQKMALEAYRATGNKVYTNGLPWDARLDGSNPIDGNTAESSGSGSHNGLSGSLVLIDTSKSWGSNQWLPTTAASTYIRPRYIWNRTDRSGGFIVSNTANTVTASLSGGTRNSWNSGDIYVITSGYPAVDQIGRAGPTEMFATYSVQPLSPCYMWDNVHNEGLSTQMDVAMSVPYVSGVSPDASVFIREGREYFNNTVKPDYDPFPYPHPLTGTSRAPAPPSNLAITPDP